MRSLEEKSYIVKAYAETTQKHSKHRPPSVVLLCFEIPPVERQARLKTKGPLKRISPSEAQGQAWIEPDQAG
eukprot:7016280-Pyramimonas_sp.AAC.1